MAIKIKSDKYLIRIEFQHFINKPIMKFQMKLASFTNLKKQIINQLQTLFLIRPLAELAMAMENNASGKYGCGLLLSARQNVMTASGSFRQT